MKFVDRCRGLLWLPQSRIRPSPHNFRLHPERQRAVLAGILADVGLADSLLVYVPDAAARGDLAAIQPGDTRAFLSWAEAFTGDVVLIDGHLRADVARDQPLCCLVVDCDAAEAAELLAVHDPVAALAEFDGGQYEKLLAEFQPRHPEVADFVALLAAAEGRMQEGAAALTGAGAGDAGGSESPADQRQQGAGDGPRPSLTDRFGVPPFSVLDARQGYWQARKRIWLSLGIQSELGRGEGACNAAPGGAPMPLDRDGKGPGGPRGGAAPGGSPRPAMKLGADGHTQRGDGYGRPLGGQTAA